MCILIGAPVVNRTWGHAAVAWDYIAANLEPGHKLSDAKLAGADLRGSKIEGVRLGLKELQGAIVDMEQAIAIARLLGVVVQLD